MRGEGEGSEGNACHTGYFETRIYFSNFNSKDKNKHSQNYAAYIIRTTFEREYESLEPTPILDSVYQ